MLYLLIANAVDDTPAAILLNNLFFFVAFNTTGMLTCYSLESYVRSDFLQRRIIQRQTEQLQKTLAEVEKQRRAAEDMSHLDAMTNLFNRRYFFSMVEEECERDRRFLREACMILLDLDDFKSINDTYGHLVGDQVLRAFAQIFKNSVRQGDVPCRYGGEEFAILLQRSDLEQIPL